MISGPIASGKSTVAAALARVLRERCTVALVDLDTVAAMALPTLGDWEWAHYAHAQLVHAWLKTGVDVVIDEGTSNRHEVDLILEGLPRGTKVQHVILTADYRHSLKRALGDPERGISKDPDFLLRDHEAFARELPQLPAGLVLDVETRTPHELASLIASHYFA